MYLAQIITKYCFAISAKLTGNQIVIRFALASAESPKLNIFDMSNAVAVMHLHSSYLNHVKVNACVILPETKNGFYTCQINVF